MGIYDRDYYRREGPSYLGSMLSTGQVCKWLIIINVAVFVIQLVTNSPGNPMLGRRPETGFFTNFFILNTSQVMNGQVWRLFTYAFLHDPGSIFHILFNMLFLWWFGRDIESIYGSREFLAFYCVAAILGGLAFQATYLMGWGIRPCLGASGAVAAVVVLCAFHFPYRTILLFFVIPVPFWLLATIFVAKDAFVLLTGARGNVAVQVHLAGAAFAALYFQSQMRILSFGSGFTGWFRRRNQPKLRIYHGEEPRQPAIAAAPARPKIDEQLEAKLDAVLEKVAHRGQASLTESEKEILQRASEIYQKKRN